MKLHKILVTLKEACGRWSVKRVAAFSAFWVATAYAFMPAFVPEFTVHEFVFWGFITFSGTALGLTVWNKKIDKANLSQ